MYSRHVEMSERYSNMDEMKLLLDFAWATHTQQLNAVSLQSVMMITLYIFAYAKWPGYNCLWPRTLSWINDFIIFICSAVRVDLGWVCVPWKERGNWEGRRYWLLVHQFNLTVNVVAIDGWRRCEAHRQICVKCNLNIWFLAWSRGHTMTVRRTHTAREINF